MPAELIDTFRETGLAAEDLEEGKFFIGGLIIGRNNSTWTNMTTLERFGHNLRLHFYHVETEGDEVTSVIHGNHIEYDSRTHREIYSGLNSLLAEAERKR